jgi:hypothetical protein
VEELPDNDDHHQHEASQPNEGADADPTTPNQQAGDCQGDDSAGRSHGLVEFVLGSKQVFRRFVVVMVLLMAFITILAFIVVDGLDSFTFDATTQSLTTAVLTIITTISGAVAAAISIMGRKGR